MKHALLILAHKNIEQLLRLIKVLQSERFDIYVHLDSKWSISEKEIERIKTNFSNVTVLDKRFSGVLDTWSLVDITCELLKTAAVKSKSEGFSYGYYYLLSGQDYPIKPVDYIADYLDKLYPRPLIDCTPKSNTNWVNSTFKRIRFVKVYNIINKVSKNTKIQKICKVPIYVFQEILTMILGSPKNNLEKLGIKLYGGSAWWVLPNVAVDFILDQFENNFKLIKQYKRATTPEETFFQTMVMRSPLANQVELNDENESEQNCMTFAYFTDENKQFTGHPYVLGIDEFDKVKSLNHLFARKFDILLDSQILELIDKEILNCKVDERI